jgi:hypothetical protein
MVTRISVFGGLEIYILSQLLRQERSCIAMVVIRTPESLRLSNGKLHPTCRSMGARAGFVRRNGCDAHALVPVSFTRGKLRAHISLLVRQPSSGVAMVATLRATYLPSPKNKRMPPSPPPIRRIKYIGKKERKLWMGDSSELTCGTGARTLAICFSPAHSD